MKVYKDIISGDELCSDSFRQEEDDFFLTVYGKMVVRTEGDYGIPGEEGEVDAASSTSVIDVVDAGRLQEYPLAKDGIMSELKQTCTAIKEALVERGQPEKAEQFEKDAPANLRPLIVKARKDELTFYKGESLTGQIIMVDWNEEGDPVFKFFKAGLDEVKY